MTTPSATGGSFKRRDTLIDYERVVQDLWEKAHPYDIEADPSCSAETFYVTFPIPYMNGRLHLGHAFSLTKAEFIARFNRLQGKRVLWPFAFHCTGMPIAACADKLRHELEDEGKDIEIVDAEEIEEKDMTAKIGTYGSKRSKAVAKTGLAKTQFDILKSVGVPEEEIPKFADAHHWLKYFPPLGKRDLIKFGLGVDWRRAFITTDANPYFDKFVQWQFKLLLERNRIKFGLRPAIFSRIDNQPCADHDRASGEAANPQAYTLIKIKINHPPTNWLEKAPCLKDANVYLVAATMRPETMYGQTNCFVLPSGDYGVYPAFEKQLTMDEIMSDQKGYVALKTMELQDMLKLKCFFISSSRAASNMAYQGIIPAAPLQKGEQYQNPVSLFQVKGSELLGLELTAPMSLHKTVYVLPLPSIKMDKGTGVVTSVPSDAPDDYAMLKDLQTKEKVRKEFGVDPEWCNRDIIEIQEIPGYGRRSAVDLCEKKKVSSWKDEVKLKEIKAELYVKSFYEGIMIVGEYAGKPVKDVKDAIKAKMIADGMAVPYLEPERRVMSRSGDDCVVALCNQWYSDFSNPEWKAAVAAHVANENSFEAYGQRSAYVHTVQWLEGWACSRNYGLGTLLPWEAEQGNRVLIESLSDSTIYFAYYTIAHYLHGDMYGQSPGMLNIKPEDLTMEVLNYVFCQTQELPTHSSISEQNLKRMRETFLYWYPMNLRCSGKDLVPNHLTMSLFHHAAIWPNNPELWPRGFYVNGHLMLDAEKMSKSTGNFLTIDEACSAFSADGTRIGLADSGDSVDDANFERQTANTGLMRLYLLAQFAEEIVQKREQGTLRTGSKTHLDSMIENEAVNLVQLCKNAYETMNMRDALKYGFFEYLALKDTYRNMLDASEEFHQDVIFQWIENLCIIMSPITCFTCEYIWSQILKKPSLVVREQWPSFSNQFNGDVHRQYQLIMDVAEYARRQLEKQASTKKGKNSTSPVARPDSATLIVAREYQPWQQEVLHILRTLELDPKTHQPLDPKFIDRVKNDENLKSRIPPNLFKDALGFASYQMKEEVKLRGPSALDLSMPFDEKELIELYSSYLKRSIGVKNLTVMLKEESADSTMPQKKDLATPGKPLVIFSTSQSQ